MNYEIEAWCYVITKRDKEDFIKLKGYITKLKFGWFTKQI